ncbi:DNA repair endonuclease XPF-like protein, partial [Leptotrombidium deliense]
MASQSPKFEPLSLLEFQKEMFDDVFNSDCLLIASKGLGLHSLLLNVIEAYNSGKNLVLVIGASQDLEEFIVSHFRRKMCKRMPRIVNSDCGTNERSKLYEIGGTLLITSRILVVDMLLKRIPIPEITGIIVCKADLIVDSCQEAFILRLFRMHNKTGFIKGLSQNPMGFTQGFAKLDRVMRHLFVRDLFLWPRFHASISASFDSRTKPEVIEIRLPLTQEMKTIQFALMDLISMCLKEMVRSNVALLSDMEGMTAENAISPGFNRMIRLRFDPVWHQLSSKTKRFISDINLLRELLFLLTNEDCVSFYATLNAIRRNVKLGMDISDWLFWDPTQHLFRAAKERLFNVETNTEKAVLEVNQKWLSFVEVINEIKAEVNHETLTDDVNVVVIVEEERTIKKLQEVLDKGVDCLLNEIYQRNQKTIAETPNEISVNDVKRSSKLDESITLTQIVRNFDYKEELFKKQGSFNIHYHCLYDGPLKLEQILREFKPWFFILYDPLMETVRQLEVYQALKCSPEKSKVYFFLYDKSAEEQKYLTSLRKEKSAFEQLIKDKASMVIPVERDGKNEHHP